MLETDNLIYYSYNRTKCDKVSSSLEREIEELFDELGINRIYSKIYIGLIKLGGKGTVEDLIKHTGLSRSLMYKGLKELEKLGLVLSLATKPKTYVLSPPKENLKRLVKNKVKSLIERTEHVTSIIESALVTHIGSIEPVYSTIDGWNNIINMVHFVIKSAKHEILMFIPVNFVNEYIVDLAEARSRGVYVDLTISNISSMNSRIMDKDLLKVATIVRARPYGSRLIVIADNRMVLLAPLAWVSGEPLGIRALLAEDLDVTFIFTSYYHGRIISSSLVIRRNINVGDKYTFVNIGTALDFIQHAKKYKYELLAKVRGLDNITKRQVILEGSIYDVILKPHKGIFSLLIDTGGIIYTIGGYRAFIEDISAQEVTIEVTDPIQDYLSKNSNLQ